MGLAASRLSDLAVLTSDNPRSEDPDRIIAEVASGATGSGQVRIDADRARAISMALGAAEAGDVVVIAGKGHETGQEIGGRVLPLRRRRGGPGGAGRPAAGRCRGCPSVTAILLAAGMALLISMITTPLLISWLRAHGIGQQIREDGPQGHLTKAGTPTMGGVAIMAATLGGYLVAHIKTVFTERGVLAMLAIGGAAGIGFADDWIKVRRHRSLGLNKRAKLGGQLIVALGFAVGCVYWLKVDTHLSFTRYNSLHSTSTRWAGSSSPCS